MNFFNKLDDIYSKRKKKLEKLEAGEFYSRLKRQSLHADLIYEGI